MIKKNLNGAAVYEFEIFQRFGERLQHAIFTRRMNIGDAISIQKILGSPTPPVQFEQQLHGTETHIVDESLRIPNGDALITKKTAAPLLIRIADCASIQLFDPVQNAIANIHAGWRGLAGRIIQKTIEAMAEKFSSKPENIFAGISPMIGPCCCRFSNPENELPKFFHQYILKNNMVDLWSAAEDQLVEAGLKKKNIENPRLCTSCHTEEFFSYRREKNPSGRFGTAIMLR